MNARLATAAFVLAVFAGFVPLFAQAPYLVADLNTTVPDGASSSNPAQFQRFGETVFFSATTAGKGRELWKYTAGSGASMVADIAPGSASSVPGLLTEISAGVFLFRATDSTHGDELWRTDGTAVGTSLVKDIHPSGNGMASSMTAVFDGKFFFFADDGIHGGEPWYSDGTEGGTQMLLDLDGTSASSSVAIIFAVDDQLFLFGAGGLWVSDGTAEGTTRIATVGFASGIARIGSTLFFTATGTGESGRELWKTDGTAAGTQMVKDIVAGSGSGLLSSASLIPIGSTLYFTAKSGFSGVSLWKTDGTSAGTELVKVLASSSGWVLADVTLDGNLFLEVNSVIWRSDGTTAGTVVLDSGVSNLVSAFGQLYYFRNGSPMQMWTSTGGTNSFVFSIQYAFNLTSAGGTLYFSGQDQYGQEPWVSEEGTAQSTHRLANLNQDLPASSNPMDLTADGDVVFFRANDGVSADAVYRSDGTSGGTFRLVSSTSPRQLTGWRGGAFFVDPSYALWRSDGTVAGTALLKSFSEYGSSYWPSKFYPGSRYLFFGAGNLPWRADGTPLGTTTVSEGLADQSTPYTPSAFAELAGRVYIDAETNPSGIWVTEGDAATTTRIFTAPYSLGSISNLTTAAGAIFFADDRCVAQHQ